MSIPRLQAEPPPRSTRPQVMATLSSLGQALILRLRSRHHVPPVTKPRLLLSGMSFLPPALPARSGTHQHFFSDVHVVAKRTQRLLSCCLQRAVIGLDRLLWGKLAIRDRTHELNHSKRIFG